MFGQITGHTDYRQGGPTVVGGVATSPMVRTRGTSPPLDGNYATTTGTTTGAVVQLGKEQNLYSANLRSNVNLERANRLRKSHDRNAVHHQNVECAEDLPRKGWKVDFENGLSDSAISPDMPEYFLTSEFYEVAKNETTTQSGKENAIYNQVGHYGMDTQVGITNTSGETRLLDDSAISEEAPDWWRSSGGHTLVSRNFGYIKRDQGRLRQQQELEKFRQGDGERNPVLQQYPSTEPISYKVTGPEKSGVRVDFGPDGPSDCAMSADMPAYFLTNPHFEVVQGSDATTKGQVLGGVWGKAMGDATSGVKASAQVGGKMLSDTSVSGDMPEWAINASVEVNDVPFDRYNRDVLSREKRPHKANLQSDYDPTKFEPPKGSFMEQEMRKKMQRSSLETVLDWDKPTPPSTSTMRRSASEVLSPYLARSPPPRADKLRVSVTSTGVHVEDHSQASPQIARVGSSSMLGIASPVGRQPSHMSAYDRATKPRLEPGSTVPQHYGLQGKRSGQHSFIGPGVVCEEQAPVNAPSHFMPYDHRSGHRSSWIAPPRERAKMISVGDGGGYRRWD